MIMQCKMGTFIAFLVIGFVAKIPYGNCSTSPGRNPENGKNQYRFRMNLNKCIWILSLVKEAGTVAVLEYETVTYNGKFAETCILFDGYGKNPPQLIFRGTFRLVKPLHGIMPGIGPVSESFQLPKDYGPLIRYERVPVLRRLSPLLSVEMLAEKKLVLAITPKGAPNPLHGDFVGPLAPVDVEDLAEVAVFLGKEPLAKLDEKSSLALLDSPNPWKAYLGLVRLKTLGVLSVQNFGRAIRAIPVENGEWALMDMISLAERNNRLCPELLKELTGFFDGTGAVKQGQLLNALNNYMDRNRHYVGRIINFEELKKAAREYRARIAKNPDYQEVVRQLDILLKFQPGLK